MSLSRNNKYSAYIVFNAALAPYRIDFFNSIAELGSASFYFTQQEVEGSQFSLRQMSAKCKFIPKFLKVINIFQRKIPCFIWKILYESRPKYVFVPEYSFISLLISMFI